MDYPFNDSIKRKNNEIILGNAELERAFEEEDVIDNSEQKAGEKENG